MQTASAAQQEPWRTRAGPTLGPGPASANRVSPETTATPARRASTGSAVRVRRAHLSLTRQEHPHGCTKHTSCKKQHFHLHPSPTELTSHTPPISHSHTCDLIQSQSRGDDVMLVSVIHKHNTDTCVCVCVQPVSVQGLAAWAGHVTRSPVTVCVAAGSWVLSAIGVLRATSATRCASVSPAHQTRTLSYTQRSPHDLQHACSSACRSAGAHT